MQEQPYRDEDDHADRSTQEANPATGDRSWGLAGHRLTAPGCPPAAMPLGGLGPGDNHGADPFPTGITGGKTLRWILRRPPLPLGMLG